MFSEDFTVYTDPSGLGDIAIIEGEEVWGVFDRQYIEVSGVDGYSPTFLVADDDAGSITKNSTIISVDLVDYLAVAKQPDGTGMTLLILEES